jgi:hypothetical protein
MKHQLRQAVSSTASGLLKQAIGRRGERARNSESTSANPRIDVIYISKVIRNSGTELEEVWNVTRP